MGASLLEEPAVDCGHTAHDEAFNELIRAAVTVIGLSIAPADTVDLDVKQTGAVHRLQAAARDFVLSVDTLPESERPIGWKPVIPGEKLQAALVQLSDEVTSIRTEYGGLHDNRAIGRRAGLTEAVNAISLAIVGGVPESSTAGTGSRFPVCAGEG